MTPRILLRLVASAALLAMSALTLWAGAQPDSPQTSTVVAPPTGAQATTSTTTTAPTAMSFRPGVTASMAPPPSH